MTLCEKYVDFMKFRRFFYGKVSRGTDFFKNSKPEILPLFSLATEKLCSSLRSCKSQDLFLCAA